MAKEKITPPAPAAISVAYPVLTAEQKFQIRDLQLRQTTAQIQFQNASGNLRQAETKFREYITALVAELKIDPTVTQFNIDNLEFEKRVEPPAGQ